jgi:hypothetical protein
VEKKPFAPNTGYAFAVGDNTWHSADPVGGQVKTRDSILLTYFVDAGVLRYLRNRQARRQFRPTGSSTSRGGGGRNTQAIGDAPHPTCSRCALARRPLPASDNPGRHAFCLLVPSWCPPSRYASSAASRCAGHPPPRDGAAVMTLPGMPSEPPRCRCHSKWSRRGVVESRPTQRVVLGAVLLDAENDESADGLASPRTAPPPLPRGRLAGSARPLALAADTATPGDPSLPLTPASCAPDTSARCPGYTGRARGGRGRATPTGPRGCDSRIVPRPQRAKSDH